MSHAVHLAIIVSLAALTVGCLDPSERRPGFRLTGEVAESLPDDWSFTNEHKEIAVEVRTPYWLPHSVTIWCAELDGRLFLGAREPETKRWPGWVDQDPNVRLGIGDEVYEVRLEPLEDEEQIGRLRQVYAAKYDLQPPPPGEAPPIRYWSVVPRS